MDAQFVDIAYIIAAVLFIFGIKMLGSATTARRGNQISALGMLIAIAATMLYSGLDYTYITAGLAAGAVIGAAWALFAKMTAMPELVALFNGFGGLASLLVAWAEFEAGKMSGLVSSSSIGAAILIGGVTCTGSCIAFLKLAGILSGRPTLFAGQKPLNAAIFTLSLAAAIFLCTGEKAYALYALVALSLLLGVLGVLPVGGGDMPVIIAFLNSFSGLAAAAAGFVILNKVLIVAGCLVGASGIILTVIMCKAMNRTLVNVLFGGFGAGGGPAANVEGEMKPISIEDAYYILEAAQNVVFVPGYGMAVAQAQHAVKELGSLLEKHGATVRYAIHPVAGRMPGHMNVLLAEADVAYEQLCEMDSVNSTISQVDVAIVIGANDVVNPAAAEDPSSPIFGMPIINAHEARTVFALKRGKGTGFSGLENALFFRQNCRMIYGDAKETITALAAQFKS